VNWTGSGKADQSSSYPRLGDSDFYKEQKMNAQSKGLRASAQSCTSMRVETRELLRFAFLPRVPEQHLHVSMRKTPARNQ
jgi:hypothetical protein